MLDPPEELDASAVVSDAPEPVDVVTGALVEPGPSLLAAPLELDPESASTSVGSSPHATADASSPTVAHTHLIARR